MASITNISSPTNLLTDVIVYDQLLRLTDTTFILKYCKSSDSYVARARVGTVDGSGNVTFGNEHIIVPAGDGSFTELCRIDDTRFAVAYYDDGAIPKNHAAAIGTVSGYNISMGSSYTFSTENSRYYTISCALDSNTLIVGHGDSTNCAFSVGTISNGDQISFGSSVVGISAYTDYRSMISLGNQHFAVAYSDRDDASNRGKVVLGKYSGGSLSFFGPYNFNIGYAFSLSAAALTDTTFVMTYSNADNSTLLTGIIGTRTGDSLSLGSKYVLDTGSGGTIFSFHCTTRLDDTHFATTYRDSGDNGRVVMGELSGSLITPNSPHSIYTGFYRTATICRVNDDYTVLSYSKETTGTTVDYRVLTTDGVGVVPDTENPAISISIPTALETYITNSSTIAMSGTASDNVELTSVTWSNSAGGSGTAVGTTSWSIPSISLSEGENVITITATDTSTNTGTDTITITRDTVDPVVNIMTPRQNYPTGLSDIDLAGTVTDSSAITSVDWSSSNSESGTASGTLSWDVYDATIVKGNNTFQINAHDEAGNTGFSTVVVEQIPDRNKTRGIYGYSSVKGNLRGKAAEGWVRPTLKQFYTSFPDFQAVSKNLYAKSVVFDFANNWGKTSYIGVRAVQFYLNDELITMTSGFGAYATTFYNSNFTPAHAFNTSYSLTGSWSGTSWMSGLNLRTNQRLLVVFDTPLEFDKIVLVNTHTTYAQTDTGVRNTVVTLSDDPIMNTTYNNPITNGTVVFSGEIPQYGIGGESFVIVEA